MPPESRFWKGDDDRMKEETFSGETWQQYQGMRMTTQNLAAIMRKTRIDSEWKALRSFLSVQEALAFMNRPEEKLSLLQSRIEEAGHNVSQEDLITAHVLYEMERRGIGVKTEVLNRWGPEYAKYLKEGRLYPHWRMYASKTGRIHSSMPNAQGMKKELREEGIVPELGYEIISIDFVTQELYLLAALAGCVDWHPKDVYREIAAETLGVAEDQVSDVERKTIKGIVIPKLYGLGRMGLDEKVAKARLAGVEFTTQKFEAAYQKAIPFTGGMLDGIVKEGGARALDGSWLSIDAMGGETKALSFLAQNAGAMVLKRLVAKLAPRAPNVFIVMLLHDEVILEIESCMLKSVLPEIRELFSSVLLDFGIDYLLPITVKRKDGTL